MRPCAAIVVTLSAVISGLLSAADPVKPNILFIVSDDQGYNDAGFMGSKEIFTPSLDKLAKGGLVLKSHYVQPICSPTRATLMTGRTVGHTGVYTVVKPKTQWGLPLDERTLAQALKENGYETAIVGKWHLGEYKEDYLPTRRGFDHQYGHWFGELDYFTHMRDGMLDWHKDDQLCHDEGYSTHLIAKEACRAIREKQKDKPLFLYMPFNAVHGPHQVPEKYSESFSSLQGVRKTYAGMTAAMDEAIGQVVATLDETGIRDNTLIIFTSDNGGPNPGKVTDNAPLRGGKGSIYEGGVRVCALVNWAGHIPEGKETNEIIHAVDWYPTLLTLTGGSLEQKKPIDGLDVWPVLTTGVKSPHQDMILWGIKQDMAALRSGEWKLIMNTAEKKNGDGSSERVIKNFTLYNLANDIAESKDMAEENPEKAKELSERLLALMKDSVPCGEPAGGKMLKK